MSRCAYCEQDLPGDEKVCRDCFEKLSAGESMRKWRVAELWPGLLAVAVIYVGMTFLPAGVIHALHGFSHFVAGMSFAVQLVLFGLAIVLAIWNSWIWRSWLRLFFWVTGLFAIIALLMWINDANRAWQIFGLISIFVSTSLRMVSKAEEFLED
jgi:predicted nucleic acid-binding Zn ribbon protein